MKVLAVDPGLTGGIACLEGSVLTSASPMPLLRLGSRKYVDPSPIWDTLQTFEPDVVATEMAWPRPREGVASSFTSGVNFGIVFAQLLDYANSSSDYPVQLVAPAVWKRWAHLLKQPKSASVEAAVGLFGWGARERWFPKKKDHGIAEAALIAEYVRQKLI